MPKYQLHRSRVDEDHRRTASGSDRARISKAKKTTVAVICGGPSVEHEVSLWSAKNILAACLGADYVVKIIYVQKNGEWLAVDVLPEGGESPKGRVVSLVPGRGLMVDGALMSVDVAFPIIHGTGGEDGTLQGALELLGIPYVGCGVLGSAIGMDKVMTKRLAEQIGIPVAKYKDHWLEGAAR